MDATFVWLIFFAALAVAAGIGWLATDFEVVAGIGHKRAGTVPPLPPIPPAPPKAFLSTIVACRFCGTGYIKPRECCKGCGADLTGG